MKKTLALVLSIVLVLTAAICVFAFSASADADLATTEANKIWNAATNKATKVLISGTSASKGTEAVSVASPAEGNLADLNVGFTGGTYKFADGVFTVTNPTFADGKYGHIIASGAAGDLKVVINGTWKGVVRNDYSDKGSDLLVTSETGGKIVSAAANTIRSYGDLVLYGNIGLEVTCTGQAIVKDADENGGQTILAPQAGATITTENGKSGENPAYWPSIDIRSGNLTFAGTGKITVNNNSKRDAITSNTAAIVVPGVLKITEDVDLAVNTVALTPILSTLKATASAASDGVVFDGNAVVKLKATDFHGLAWGKNNALICSDASVRVAGNAKVLASMHLAQQSAGAAVLINVSNAGGPSGHRDNGVFFEDNAEFVGKMTIVDSITSPYAVGLWVNNGLVESNDNAKVTVDLPNVGGNAWAVNLKLGAFRVNDAAKVRLTGPKYTLRIELNKSTWPTTTENDRAYWLENMGVQVTGGQLEVVSLNGLTVDTVQQDAAVLNKLHLTNRFKFTGGVVLLNPKNNNYAFGTYGHEAADFANYAFIGNLSRETSATWSQNQFDRMWTAGSMPSTWGYFAKDAAYTYYNGITENVDFFGAAANEETTIVNVTYDNAGKATYKYTMPTKANYKIGDGVIAYNKGDVIESATPLTIAITTAAATPAAAPANLKVVDGSVTSSGAKLTWDAAAYAVSYNIYANGTLAGSTDKTELEVALPSNSELKIVVKGVNSAGAEGAASNEITVTTPKGDSDYQKPTAPANVKVSGLDKVSGIVSWDAVTDAASYDVYLNGEKVNTTPVTTTSFDLTGLTAATDYKVQVTASNVAGTSDKSAEVAFKTGLEGVAQSVTIVLADGTSVVLNKEKLSSAVGTGTATFDNCTGTVTIENINGAQAIQASKAENLTVVVKGTNTLENTTQGNALCALILTVEGDGTLNLKNTKNDAYVVLGQQAMEFRGSVKINFESNSTKGAFHAARTNGDNYVIVKDNVQLNMKTVGAALYAAGERSRVIITDNAVVTIDSGSDAINATSDSDKAEWTGEAEAYVEISKNAKVTVVAGSCGLRIASPLKGTADAPIAKDGKSSCVISDNAVVDITAKGQVIYCSFDATNNSGKITGYYTQSGNAKVTLVNTGTYAGIDVRGNANKNEINVLGGTLEITAPEKSAFNTQGKTNYNVGAKATLLAGADKDSAKEVAKIATSYKYFKITNAAVNADTSDFVPAVAVVALFATVACAAMIVLRKKAHNA